MKLTSTFYIFGGLLLLFPIGSQGSQPTEEVSSCSINKESVAEIADCPAWFKPGENGTCQCGEDVQPSLIHCDNATKVTTISILACITFDNTTGTVYGGRCPYNTINTNASFSVKPRVTLSGNVSRLDDKMCGPLNKTGLLCSKCREGLGIPLMSYSSKCIECLDSKYGWLVYILAAFGLTTVLGALIIVCRIDATSPGLNLMIMTSQLLVNGHYYLPSVYNVKPFSTFIAIGLSMYGLWNFEIFRGVLPPFCISSKMNTLQVIVLDYLVALYPLVLTAIIYYCIEFHDRGNRVLMVLWKPFHRCVVRFRRSWEIKGSVINAFATFLLLSYCKLLNISFGMLVPVTLYNGCGETSIRVYYEPSFRFFGKSHLPYAILSLLILLVFVFLPLLYILFYQNKYFQRCLEACRLRITLLNELANVCQIHYKNGLNGDPDYRWYAGVYLIFRILFAIHYTPKLGNLPAIISSGVATVLCAIVRPFKNKYFNVFETIAWAMWTLGVIYFSLLFPTNVYNLPHTPLFVAATLPLVYLICFILFNFLRRAACSRNIYIALKNLYTRLKEKIAPTHDEENPIVLDLPSETEPLLSYSRDNCH